MGMKKRKRSFFLGLLLGLMGILFISHSLLAWSQSAAPTKRPALNEFGAKTCIPCIQMKQVMAELTTSHGDRVEFRMVYADEERDLFRQYKIMLIPTQVFFNAEGKEVDRHIGPLTKEEVLQKLKELRLIN
jgi:thioredoxin 1